MGGIVGKYAFLPPTPLCGPNHPLIKNDLVWLTNSLGHRFPALHIKRSNAKKTLLFSHGNAEDITYCEDWLKRLSKECNVNVFAFEYPGYSFTCDASGKPLQPTEDFCYENSYASYDYLTTKCNVQPNDIIAFGRSLGSGCATNISVKRQVGGLILMSPLMSAIRVVMKTMFTWPMDIFANIDKIDKVTAPVFIMHGLSDEVIAYSHGEQLYNCATKARFKDLWLIPGVGHNDILDHYESEVYERIRQFISKLDETDDKNSS